MLGQAEAEAFGAKQAAEFIQRYCIDCHAGTDGEAGIDLSSFSVPQLEQESVLKDYAELWQNMARRVKDSGMPPEGSDQPEFAARMEFVDWVGQELHRVVCGLGIRPAPARLRRMNRSEYAGTIRDLLEIQINAAEGLPDDGAGGGRL
ncbi:MAG: DUF1587 domain-containing protein [bacterium]|nr:DUF1587 domain-containing protein [bacterium]